MHPVAYLFEEIYRDYWGLPRAAERERERERRRHEGPEWQARWPRRHERNR
jgi:hypothetical protein